MRARIGRALLLVLLAAAVGLTAWASQGEGEAKAPGKEEAPGRFVPSEELPADSAVAFPVDI